MSREELIAENKKCWDSFYSWQAIQERLKGEFLSSRSFSATVAYVFFCLGFKRIYAGHGTSSKKVRKTSMGLTTRSIVRLGLALYGLLYRRRFGFRVPLVRPAPPQ
jgi:hypothetical protein